MNKILILGGSGLLGYALVKVFQAQGYTVGVVSRKKVEDKSYSIKTNMYIVDILNYKSLAATIENYDIVINCTGQITRPINQCLVMNTKGISNIINAVKEHKKRLIHISSLSVYGTANYVNELNILNPETPYGTSKYLAEYLIQSSLDKYTILRISNLFAKQQKKGIIHYLTQSYLNDIKDIHFNNNGNLKRYYIHTQDIADMIYEVINKNIEGIYNVIGKELISIKDLVGKFEETLNYKFNVSYSNTKAIENIDCVDSTEIAKSIDRKFKIDITQYIEGIRK